MGAGVCVWVCVGGVDAWGSHVLLHAYTKGPQHFHTHPQHPSSPQAAYMHPRPTQHGSACCGGGVCVCVCVCVCVHVCVCGGETQPLVGVDLERWTGDVMASPQGPSSCFGGHWCHHTGPRSPKMAARALLAQVSGQHTPTARLGRLNR